MLREAHEGKEDYYRMARAETLVRKAIYEDSMSNFFVK
jgi:hypothetical protein